MSQDKQIEKMIAKFGGSNNDVWAIGQAGSGFVRFDGNFIHIQHSGFLSRVTVGKGAKRIPIRALSAIQLKPAGAVVSGYIQFTMSGSNEVRSAFGKQSFDAAGDENSIMFTRAEQPYFEALRDTVERAISHIDAPVAADPSQEPLAQLKGLAELRDAGIVSEAEFESKKAEILKRL